VLEIQNRKSQIVNSDRDDMSRLAIILFGPPAAGKGTQAHMVGAALQLPVISTGDILREAVRNKTELGKEAKQHMETGALVPDELVDAIVKERLQRDDCVSGFILDGYPRTVHQAVFIESAFNADDLRIQVVGIAVADDVLIRRVAGRRSCPKCGKVFNFSAGPGKNGAICDECSTPLVSRVDDSAEVVAQRLKVYHRQTQPLIDYYRGRGCYIEVDGDRPVDEVNESILKIVRDQVGTPAKNAR
jgi:adenylate kinase